MGKKSKIQSASNSKKEKNNSENSQKEAPESIIRNKDFQERISYLDDISSESQLSQSTFKGLFNFLVTFALVHFVMTSYVNYKKTGFFFELEIYNNVKRDYFLAVAVWPLFYLYSHMFHYVLI